MTDVLDRLEEDFKAEAAHHCEQAGLVCDEKAVWSHRWACCGLKRLVCGMHKYGIDPHTLAPLHPRHRAPQDLSRHIPCGTITTWAEILERDTWTRL